MSRQTSLASFFTAPKKLAAKTANNDNRSNAAAATTTAKRVAVRTDEVLAQLHAVATATTTTAATTTTNEALQMAAFAPTAVPPPPPVVVDATARALRLLEQQRPATAASFEYSSAATAPLKVARIDLTGDDEDDDDDDDDDDGDDLEAQNDRQARSKPPGSVFESFAFDPKRTSSAPTFNAKKRSLPLAAADDDDDDGGGVEIVREVRTLTSSSSSYAAAGVKVLSSSSTTTSSSRVLPPSILSAPRSIASFMPVKSRGSGVAASATALASEDVRMLTAEQRAVFALVDQCESVFFTGSAGTGKSLLLTVLIRHLRERWGDDTVAVTASTGAAAVNIGGTTLHAFAGIGLGNKPVAQLAESAKKNEQVRRRWQRCKFLIIDEISMIPADLFDKIEYVARHVRSERGRPNAQPFGGITVVLAGDFLQLPPVPERGQTQAATKYAFQSDAWQFAVQHHVLLNQVHRQRDESFVTMLNELRRGQYTDASRRLLEARRNVRLARPVRLYSRRVDVSAENAAELARLPGDTIRFAAKDTVKFEQYREQLDKYCNAPAQLELKIGAQVLLLKNLAVADGLVNGSQGTVVGFAGDKRQMPTVRFANGLERVMEPHEWTIEVGGVECAKRTQVPLMLAWAISIHKSQGLTLDEASCDLSSVFTTGQAYVALSRVRSLAGLSVTSLPSSFATDPTVVQFYDKLAAQTSTSVTQAQKK